MAIRCFSAKPAAPPRPAFVSERVTSACRCRSLPSPTFADIDGDGDLDAFVGNLTATRCFSATAPRRRRTDALAATASNFGLTDVGFVASPAFADIDGDGDLDAFVGNAEGITRFFLNIATSGVTITQSGGSTAVTEGGATDSYTVVLKSAPSADVVITLNTTNHQVATAVPT